MKTTHFFIVLSLFITTASFKLSQPLRYRTSLFSTPSNKQNNVFFNFLTEKFKESIKSIHTYNTMKRAKKIGFPWQQYYDLGKNNLKTLHQHFLDINNKSIVYPDYYTQKFHYYDEGNLNWIAALDVVPSTILIASKYWALTDVHTAQSWMRGNTTFAIQNHIDSFPSTHLNTGRIMDIACSGGISTKFLIEAFPDKDGIDAVDLSPYFLSVAKFNHMTSDSPIFTTLHDKITYHHMMAEDMSFPSNSYDIVSISFLTHELPTKSAEEIITEAYRVLRPGGVLCVMDIAGKAVMNKYLFELSEPHIHEYYKTNHIKIMEDTGFTFIETKENDPRNILWIGSKPEITLKKMERTIAEWKEEWDLIHQYH